MAKRFAYLERLDNDSAITYEGDYEFIYHLQISLLQALQEQGILNTIQYRQAQEKLNQQRRNRAKSILEKQGTCD